MMTRQFNYPDSGTAFREHYRWALTPDGGPDMFRGVVGWTDDVRIMIPNPDPQGLNMGLVDFTPARWSRFKEHYIEPEHFSSFLARLPKLRPSQTAGYNTPVRAPHSMGNCLIGLTAHRRRKNELELQMYSRTTIWAPTGVLDLYLGSLVADWWKRQVGMPVRLTWILTQCQFTTWKSLAFVVNLLYMEAKERGVGINDTWWGEQLLSSDPTTNRYLAAMRRTYDQARHIHLYMDRSYRLPARQTNRMLAAERRWLAGYQRDLRPSIETLMASSSMEQFLITDEDEEDLEEDLEEVEA